METRVRTEPWVIPWQKSTGKADGLLLVVWPARLFSWLPVGISEYGWEFQRWRNCHRSHGHQHFRVI